jgi:hypothetical protein
MSFIEDYFSQGENPPKTATANNVDTFALDKAEMAFIHAINFHITDIKSLVFNTVVALQNDFEEKNKSLSEIKKKFITRVAQKRGVPLPHNVEVDLVNELLVVPKVPADK